MTDESDINQQDGQEINPVGRKKHKGKGEVTPMCNEDTEINPLNTELNPICQ